jgi:hypothetical protein
MLHKTLSFTFVAYSINSFQFEEQFPKGKEKHFLIILHYLYYYFLRSLYLNDLCFQMWGVEIMTFIIHSIVNTIRYSSKYYLLYLIHMIQVIVW